VLRDGKEKNFSVKIAKRQQDKIASSNMPYKKQETFGIQVSDLTPEIANRLNLQETEGVVVTDVQSGSQGDDKGVQARDIIKEINHQSINSVNDYNNAINKVKKGETVSMFIKRANAGFFVIKLTKE